MFYLLVYDDNRHTMTTNLDDLKEIVQGLINQGVGYKVVAGEVIEEMAGVVCNDGEDIWEPIDDDFLDEQNDDEAFDYEPDYNDSFYDDKVEGDNYPWIDNDRPY